MKQAHKKAHSAVNREQSNLHYFIVPVMVLVTAFVGSKVTMQGMSWYNHLTLPEGTPNGGMIGVVWTLIFILLAVSMMIALSRSQSAEDRRATILLFAVNCLLNVLWSMIFFFMHDLQLAVWEAGALALSVLVLIFTVLPVSRIAGWLLVPYFLWVCYATYLTQTIAELNPIW